ncbi:MAG: hypothetical protein AAGG11_17580 [Pseudomonadota bacterium]
MSEAVLGSTAEDTAPADGSLTAPAKPLYVIQRPWLIGVLTALTAGTYLVFFMYIHARDLKRLGQPLTPWMYVLSPLIAIALPFAASRLSEGYSAVARKTGTEATLDGATYGGYAFVALAVLGIVDRFAAEVATLALFVCMAIVGLCFWRFARQINAVQLALPEDWYNRAPYRLTVGTWIWLLLGLPLMTLSGMVAVDEVRQLLRERIAAGETWTSPGNLFSVTPRRDWAIAQVGTFSDGSAEAEFAVSESAFVLVFDQTLAGNLADISDLRRSNFLNADNSGDCSERRWLDEDTLARRTELICRGSVLGTQVTVISSVTSDDDRAIEAFGEAYVGPGEDDASEYLKEFIGGIQLLEVKQ